MYNKKRPKRSYKKNGRFIIFINIVLIILLISYGFIYIDRQIRPTVLAIAEIKAKEIAAKAINESIHSKITDDIRYQDLYFLRTDTEGNVTFMQANTSMTKLLKNIVS